MAYRTADDVEAANKRFRDSLLATTPVVTPVLPLVTPPAITPVAASTVIPVTPVIPLVTPPVPSVQESKGQQTLLGRQQKSHVASFNINEESTKPEVDLYISHVFSLPDGPEKVKEMMNLKTLMRSYVISYPTKGRLSAIGITEDQLDRLVTTD